MNKFKYAPGWNFEKVMAQVKKYNNGSKALGNNNGEFENNLCVYKNDDGNRCAIGCFIPDGHRAFSETDTVIDLIKKYPDLIQYMPFTNLSHLREFQKSHDRSISRNEVYKCVEMFLELYAEE